jgi:sulfofructose kinase
LASVVCLGIAVQDLVFSVDVLPAGPGKHRARGVALAGGGMAASAAVVVARLGGEAELWTRLGDDVLGDDIVRELDGYGVGTAHCRRFEGRTSPVSAVLVDADGERLLVNHADPRLDDDPGWLPLDALAAADALLIDTRWPGGAVAALDGARAAGIPVVFDADSAPVERALVAGASHAIFSLEALRDYTGDDSPREGLRRVAGQTAAVVAVTCGGDGVYWIEAGGPLEHLPAFEVQVVDTLGAGDVFHGAFALALAEGQGLRDAMRFAAAAAAVKCTRFGGRAGTPGRDQVEALLRGGKGR